MIETEPAAAFILQTLRADTQLQTLFGGTARVYRDGAVPLGVGWPVIVCSFSGGSDSATVPTKRLFTRQHWMVKAIGLAPSSNAAPPFAETKAVADRADDLLHGKKLVPVTGAMIYSCVREYPMDYVHSPGLEGEAQAPREFHIGGMYTIIVQARPA